jgi:uncharacterized protein YggU (UPF0235/DUF167 family)
VSTGPGATSVELSALAPDVTYLVNVEASNAVGLGPAATTTVTPLQAVAVTLGLSTTGPVVGQSVTTNVRLTRASGQPVPTGSVVIFNGSTKVAKATLVRGVAKAKVTFTDVGSDPVWAAYSGDGVYGSADSNKVVVTVNAAASTVSATGTSKAGKVTVKVAVRAAAPSDGKPTGSVTISQNGVVLATGVLVRGKVTLVLRSVPPGEQTYAVDYLGDGNYTASSTSLMLDG